MLRSIAVCVLVSMSACVVEDEPDVGTGAEASTSTNGTSVNGTSVNGTSVNGTSVNGTSVNGTSVNGTSVNGTSLHGTTLKGTTLDGLDFVGATLTGTLSTGATLALRIDAIRPLPAPNADLLGYEISYPTATGRQVLCGRDGSGAVIAAIPLAGRWDATVSWVDDPTMITWGCRGATLAKCVEMGYRPWASAKGVPLRDHHQACTRMLRADYCGNGVSNTTNGRIINVYDGLGLQTDTSSGLNWVFEADWTPTGARCILDSRILLNRINTLPQCAQLKLRVDCGLGGFSAPTLVRDKLQLDPLKLL